MAVETLRHGSIEPAHPGELLAEIVSFRHCHPPVVLSPVLREGAVGHPPATQ